MNKKKFLVLIFFLLVLTTVVCAYKDNSVEFDSNSSNYTNSFDVTHNKMNVLESDNYDDGSTSGGNTKGLTSGFVSTKKDSSQNFFWGVTKKDEELVAILTKEDIAVSEISFTVNDVFNDVKLNVNKLFEVPKTKTKNSYLSYQYLEISTNNIKEDSLSDYAIIKFKVSKEWLKRKNAYKDNIVLRKYTVKWTDLETHVIGEDEYNYFFQARTSGFSFFSISVIKDNLKPSKISDINIKNKSNVTKDNLLGGATNNNVPLGKLGEDIKKTSSSSFDWIWMFMPLVLLVVIVVFALKIKMPAPQPKLIKDQDLEVEVPESSYFSCRKFIFKMRLSGASDSDIKVILKDKGWSEEQILYVFNRLDSE